ncbi:MAG: YceI family protein [Gammaproteobacteria bacterium]|nr:YceI family protein [Gammaproteobacteria bacterium]MBI5615898.1 YceI family protein [Gammaproteobacteria bacterium]
MRITRSRAAWAAALGLAALVQVTPGYAADYKIDLSHSFVQFKISHLGFSVLNGRFDDFAGGFTWDKAKPETAAVNVTIKAASVNSNWAERDKHIRGKDFLEVDKFPEASFKSTKYTGDATGGTLDGELTLHGVTKPISIKMKAIGEGKDPWGGYRAGFAGTTTIKRSDFGVNKFELGPQSDPMDFELFIEGTQNK